MERRGSSVVWLLVVPVYVLMVSSANTVLAQPRTKTLRYRRQRLLEIEELVVQPPTPTRRQLEEYSGCGSGDYWMDMLFCNGAGSMSFSFSMPTGGGGRPSKGSSKRPSSSKNQPLPPSIDVPLPPTSPLPPTPAPPPVPTENGSTSAPTPTAVGECRSVSRLEAIVALVVPITPDLLSSPNTPAGRSLAWLTNNDTTDPCDDPLSIVQRYSLATLFYSTSGESSWADTSGWLGVGLDECQWRGVSCNGDDGTVVQIQLARNNLQGPLPAEMSALTTLQVLNVYSNQVTGSLPDLTAWPNLVMLDVEENAFTGQAFVDFSNSPQLSSYRVSINQLTGTVPSSLPTSLTELWFADNKITGVLPASIGSLTLLESLIMYENNLLGQLPSALGNAPLEQLQAHRNAFSGPIPDSLFQSTNLQDLRLEQNTFTGTLSTAIGNLVNLRELRIGENNLVGTLPAELSNLSNLILLQANSTSLVGTIPDNFGSFTSLQFVDLSINGLSGPIPASIFGTPPIRFLYLNDNELSGEIPVQYAAADSLEDFWINNNQLVGTVPPIANGQLPNLSEFRIENNGVMGTMPSSICNLRGEDDDNGLVTLSSDCGGSSPLIQCDCCSGCIAP